MVRTKTTRQLSRLAAAKRDAWDEEANWESEGTGSSWTKAYAGGVKVRQYNPSEGDGAEEPVLQRGL
jgi:hypothetical protein